MQVETRESGLSGKGLSPAKFNRRYPSLGWVILGSLSSAQLQCSPSDRSACRCVHSTVRSFDTGVIQREYLLSQCSEDNFSWKCIFVTWTSVGIVFQMARAFEGLVLYPHPHISFGFNLKKVQPHSWIEPHSLRIHAKNNFSCFFYVVIRGHM